MFYQCTLLPAVDPHVHVEQVHEGDDASGEEAGPVDVVVHVVWINSNNYELFVFAVSREAFLPEICYIIHNQGHCCVGLIVS